MSKDNNGDISRATPGAMGDLDAATSSGTEEIQQPPANDGPTSMEEAIEQALNATPRGEDGADPADADSFGNDDDPDTAPDGADTDGDDPADDSDAPGDDADTDAAKPEKADAKDGPDPEADDTELPDPTDDELKDMRSGPRRRIKQLLSQRNAARTEAEAQQGDASRYQALQGYMAEHDLVDSEVADLFRAGAELKSGTPEGFRSFLDRVGPLVIEAQEALGLSIPKDLQAQVDDGEMTEAAAGEFARTRYRADAADQRQTRQTEQRNAQFANDQRTEITSAVNGYIQSIATSDADFARKRDVMRRVSQGIVSEKGLPASAAEAVAMAKEAWAETNRVMGASVPPKATRPTPGSTASSNRSGVRPTPTSLADVIGLALDRP